MGRIKPIRRLGHQFGTLLEDPRLDSYEIGEALFRAELIEYVIHGDSGIALSPTHYRETLSERLSPAAYLERITEALIRYCKDGNIKYACRKQAKPAQPTDHYDPSDFGA